VAGLLVFAGIFGFFLGFIWPWMFIFPIILTTIIVWEKYEHYKSNIRLEEYKKNNPYIPPPPPEIGMTEREIESKSIWGHVNSIIETITSDGIERERYYDYKGRLIFKNGILVKIVKFDTKSNN